LSDYSNFLEVQTETPWGHTLADFALFCDPQPASLVLDIGCGPGLLPTFFAQRECKTFGVDYDFGLLASGLVPSLAQADAFELPFPPESFNLISATNVLFLLDDPLAALHEWRRVLAPDGELCLLNPSEKLSVDSARRLADKHSLHGAARASLLHWAQNAEDYFCWTEAETCDLLSQVGLRLKESILRVGPGFARFVRAKFD
jgi:ubiquinone/menaquinone biosynthesis C-methylase UbiE